MKSYAPVLLVEDDEIDAMTVERSFKELKIENEIVHKIDGLEAWNYLKDENSPVPCLIILDLNMPRMNGIEFLQHIKKTKEFKKIPVVVLTTSSVEKDIMESYKLGVSGYMLKPVGYQKFVELMQEINVYWSKSELPV